MIPQFLFIPIRMFMYCKKLCWLLRISVPKMRVFDVSTRSLLMPSPYQAGGKKVSQTLFLSSF
jgi:hypothetical protein